MSKPLMPSIVAHPNLGHTSTEGMQGAYDVLVARKEEFVTPQGVKGRQRVFSRVSPEQIQADKSGDLKKGALKAKARIEGAFSKLKISANKKEALLEYMGVQIKGNITASSKEFLSADAFHSANRSGKFAAAQKKEVRFAASAPAEIPLPARRTPTLPKEIILPELPPDNE